MRTVGIDRDGDGYRVSWIQGLQPPRSRRFDGRAEAEAFAGVKMGKTGYVVSTLDMSAEQWADEIKRREKLASFVQSLSPATDAPTGEAPR